MKCIRFLLLALVAFSTAIACAASSTLDQGEQQMGESIESEFHAARLFIEELVHGNAQVLNQYDLFAETLKKAFLVGEDLSEKELSRILDALRFSAQKHRFQTRKDPEKTPYIIHPIAVADNLMQIGKVRDSDIIIGALLHDTVEDTQTSFAEIEQRFGSRVTGYICEVTDDKSLPKHRRKELQIEHAPEKSVGAAQIKLADKLCNLTDLYTSPPPDWDEERIDLYFHWAKKVVDALPAVNAPLKHAVDAVIENYRKNK